jgi:hypothetical protein
MTNLPLATPKRARCRSPEALILWNYRLYGAMSSAHSEVPSHEDVILLSDHTLTRFRADISGGVNAAGKPLSINPGLRKNTPPTHTYPCVKLSKLSFLEETPKTLLLCSAALHRLKPPPSRSARSRLHFRLGSSLYHSKLMSTRTSARSTVPVR